MPHPFQSAPAGAGKGAGDELSSPHPQGIPLLDYDYHCPVSSFLMIWWRLWDAVTFLGFFLTALSPPPPPPLLQHCPLTWHWALNTPELRTFVCQWLHWFKQAWKFATLHLIFYIWSHWTPGQGHSEASDTDQTCHWDALPAAVLPLCISVCPHHFSCCCSAFSASQVTHSSHRGWKLWAPIPYFREGTRLAHLGLGAQPWINQLWPVGPTDIIEHGCGGSHQSGETASYECVKQVFSAGLWARLWISTPPPCRQSSFPTLQIQWHGGHCYWRMKDTGGIIQKRKTSVPKTSLCCPSGAPSPLPQFSQLTPHASHARTHLHSSCAMVGSHLLHTACVGAGAAQHFGGRPVRLWHWFYHLTPDFPPSGQSFTPSEPRFPQLQVDTIIPISKAWNELTCAMPLQLCLLSCRCSIVGSFCYYDHCCF